MSRPATLKIYWLIGLTVVIGAVEPDSTHLARPHSFGQTSAAANDRS